MHKSVSTLGPDHPDTLMSVNNLGLLLRDQGDFDGAEPYFRRALEAQKKALGPEHPSTFVSISNLVDLLAKKGDMAAAEAMREAFGAANRGTIGLAIGLFNTLDAKGGCNDEISALLSRYNF